MLRLDGDQVLDGFDLAIDEQDVRDGDQLVAQPFAGQQEVARPEAKDHVPEIVLLALFEPKAIRRLCPGPRKGQLKDQATDLC